jgi:hypothetical protein
VREPETVTGVNDRDRFRDARPIVGLGLGRGREHLAALALGRARLLKAVVFREDAALQLVTILLRCEDSFLLRPPSGGTSESARASPRRAASDARVLHRSQGYGASARIPRPGRCP